MRAPGGCVRQANSNRPLRVVQCPVLYLYFDPSLYFDGFFKIQNTVFHHTLRSERGTDLANWLGGRSSPPSLISSRCRTLPMLFVTGTALRNHAANIRPVCVTREILSGGEAMRLLTTLAQSFNLPRCCSVPDGKKKITL